MAEAGAMEVDNAESAEAASAASHQEALAGLRTLFEQIGSLRNKDEREHCCNEIRSALSALKPDDIGKNFTDDLLKCLSHNLPQVRLLGVDGLFRIINWNKRYYSMPENMHIAMAVTKCLTFFDLSVAIKAVDILVLTDWQRYAQVYEEVTKILDGDNISDKCKCYEMAIKIAKHSPKRLRDADIQSMLQKLIGELRVEDILGLLNIIELLSDLAMTTHGLNFLIENDVLKMLSDHYSKLQGHPIGELLIPGFMKFFGCVGYLYPNEVCKNYQFAMTNVFSAIHTGKPSHLPVALDTLGFIGSTNEGKMSLAALGREFLDVLPIVGGYIKNSPTETRVRGLNCIESLISTSFEEKDPNPSINQRVTLMTREWFRELSTGPAFMETLYNICKNPFPDLRVSALSLLLAVCQHEWGIELVKTTPGLIEFLLDRSVEHDKESKTVKYNIIKILAAATIFETSVAFRLQEYVKDGPFFVQPETRIATEGDQ